MAAVDFHRNCNADDDAVVVVDTASDVEPLASDSTDAQKVTDEERLKKMSSRDAHSHQILHQSRRYRLKKTFQAGLCDPQ